MDLNRLADTISTLKARIDSHGDRLRESETRTRMALIDPLLQALGWDTGDPDLVVPEYNTAGQRRADYALMGNDGKPKVIVEAKKLGASLESHIDQMLTYAVREGIPYSGLTDGNVWNLYHVFKVATLDERKILQVSISNQELHRIALDFLLLWRTNMATGNPATAPESIIEKKSGSGQDEESSHGEQDDEKIESTNDLIIGLKEEHPNVTHRQLADMVRDRKPGAKTTEKSVSATLSRARRKEDRETHSGSNTNQGR